MDQKIKSEIALFRYSLIAPIVTNTFTQPTMKAYLEEVCARSYDVPYYGARSFAPKTLKGWFYAYKKHGLDGLSPQKRSDQGSSRVLEPEVKEFIIDAKLTNPKRTAKSIYQELLARKLISYEQVSLPTVQRFIHAKHLSAPKIDSKERHAFEMEIERFFCTIKTQWMNLLDWDKIGSLSELNSLLHEYLEQGYHQNLHSAIQMKPIDRFIQHIANLRFVPSRQELDNIFLHQAARKVRKDATISLNSTKFEVPQAFIDEQIQIRFHPDSLEIAYIFDDSNHQLATIYPVRKVDNSRIFRGHVKNPIDFSPFNPTEKGGASNV